MGGDIEADPDPVEVEGGLSGRSRTVERIENMVSFFSQHADQAVRQVLREWGRVLNRSWRYRSQIPDAFPPIFGDVTIRNDWAPGLSQEDDVFAHDVRIPIAGKTVLNDHPSAPHSCGHLVPMDRSDELPPITRVTKLVLNIERQWEVGAVEEHGPYVDCEMSARPKQSRDQIFSLSIPMIIRIAR